MVAAALLLPLPAPAEQAVYGAVDLTGLARGSWHLNPPGKNFVMVCNVNGPVGFLTVRTGPGTQYPSARKLKRLAIVTVDSSQRQGHWIAVKTAHRNTTPEGADLAYRPLPVVGWAHDGYLCDFIH